MNAVGRRARDEVDARLCFKDAQGDIEGQRVARATSVAIGSDHRHLSEDGFVLPIIAINKLTGRVETTPEIVTRGFNPGEDGLMDGARQIVIQTLDQSSDEEKADYGVIKEKIRADLKRYISKQTQRRPLIMPVILEI